MILIGLGSNMEGPWGSPEATVARAIAALNSGGVRLVAGSRIVISAPFGKTDQPAFANAAALVETALSPEDLLARLHEIEREAGRERAERWGPRTLDMDLLSFGDAVQAGPPELPHPGILERAFVLAPVAEIAPDWRHPVTGLTAGEMLARLEGREEGRVIG